ncbi:MAG TPA: hypothetical protein VND92_03535 [Vicinamibacterales bacterium]|nr:hypothetical protein [Vicinamibacterales bacterium]
MSNTVLAASHGRALASVSAQDVARRDPSGAGAGRAVVLATTPDGTVHALRAAKDLAEDRVTVLVPCRAAGTLQITAAHEHYRLLAAREGVTASIHVCVCRRPGDLLRLLDGEASVVIGGRQRRVWPTTEQRLARRLARRGCTVTFADVTRNAGAHGNCHA